MSPIAVRITVAGRVGPVLESVFVDLVAVASPRHTVVTVVGSDSLPDVVRLLRTLERRGVEVDRVVGSTCHRG